MVPSLPMTCLKSSGVFPLRLFILNGPLAGIATAINRIAVSWHARLVQYSHQTRSRGPTVDRLTRPTLQAERHVTWLWCRRDDCAPPRHSALSISHLLRYDALHFTFSIARLARYRIPTFPWPCYPAKISIKHHLVSKNGSPASRRSK
jgi:hypothetical protein